MRELAFTSTGSSSPRDVHRVLIAALVYLRGQDADARLRELGMQRVGARPVLGALARRMVEEELWEKLGPRSLVDWARERIGMGARVVNEWARVWKARRGEGGER